MSYFLQALNLAALGTAKRITASDNGAATDISEFTGLARFLLNSSAPEGAAQTSDVKIQHSADGSTNWMDAGIAFSQVTTAGGASYQSVMASVDGLHKYVRVVNTLGGSSPAITFAVTMIGRKAGG